MQRKHNRIDRLEVSDKSHSHPPDIHSISISHIYGLRALRELMWMIVTRILMIAHVRDITITTATTIVLIRRISSMIIIIIIITTQTINIAWNRLATIIIIIIIQMITILGNRLGTIMAIITIMTLIIRLEEEDTELMITVVTEVFTNLTIDELQVHRLDSMRNAHAILSIFVNRDVFK